MPETVKIGSEQKFKRYIHQANKVTLQRAASSKIMWLSYKQLSQKRVHGILTHCESSNLTTWIHRPIDMEPTISVIMGIARHEVGMMVNDLRSHKSLVDARPLFCKDARPRLAFAAISRQPRQLLASR